MKGQFQAFCDASGTFDRRFQSIAAVSGSYDTLEKVRNTLAKISDRYGKTEIKFINVNRINGSDFRLALAFMRGVISEYCRYNKVRIDVITWDTQDSRNSIPGRNDIANLGRFYYHLILKIIKSWPEGEWDIIVDENEKISFPILKACINNGLNPSPGAFPEIMDPDNELTEFNSLVRIRELASHKELLIQLADLFAGVTRYSHEQGKECCRWLENNRNPAQLSFQNLFNDSVSEIYSTSQECRFQLIGEINNICKKNRLGVSLKNKKWLWTPDHKNPLNFWFYIPQGSYDKAPTN